KSEGWQRILLFVLPYLIIVGLFQFIGGLIAGADLTSIEFEENSIQQLVISIFDLAGTFLVLWFFMKFVDRESFINLRFSTKNRLKDFIVVFL
ncbi:CPBP family intramembrane glutamate endopeptidase, partial [Salegentibacter sp. F188]|nr:CPBP family intramembrane glutamate endopeptidase [Salegentibacter sp. F188]